MLEWLVAPRPWIRLFGFLALASFLAFASTVVVVLFGFLIPGFGDRFESPLVQPETPLRLVEESYSVLSFAMGAGAITFGILAAAVLIWRRPFRDFLWPDRSLDFRHFLTGFAVMTALAAVITPIYLIMGSEWNPPVLDTYYVAETRLIYGLAMVPLLFIGAAAEEVIFRGVLLRLTGLILRQPLLVCLLNGLLFSAIHLDPDPVAIVARTLSGMVWTWAALRLGGLEFAIGAHFANNLFLSLFWSPFSEGVQSTQSSWTELVPEIFTTLIVLITIEWLARRRHDDANPLEKRSGHPNLPTEKPA